jgi:signal transduction histidine kinase
VVVTVDDDGPGIPALERSAVFEPFYRIEPSRSRETGGAGLGLAIARAIAEAHGGRISADVAPQGGARIRVVLPAA